MADAINKQVMTQPEKINMIIDGCCKYFGVERSELEKKTGSRSSIWNKKRFMIILLNDYTSCTVKEMADYLGYNQRQGIYYHIEQMRQELGNDMFGYDKTKMVYKELLSYLNL